MQHEVTITFLVTSPYGRERTVRQVEALFAFGTLREAFAEGLHLGEEPRLLEVAVKSPVGRSGQALE
jgi:hypothetical protein